MLSSPVARSVARSAQRAASRSVPCVSSSHNLQSTRSVHVEKNMESKSITLPPPPKPAANYNLTCHASGNMLYVSGHLPLLDDGTLMTGTAGKDGIDIEHGYKAARQCGLNIVSTLKNHLDDLDRVEKVVKVFGIVNSADDFKFHHKIMDGCSDLIMEIFDKDVGYHARSAIGTNTLPLDTLVEVEAIVQIKPE